jgi:hypothetical protein
VVWGDPYTEGSQTAKFGTDEQKPDMRLLNEDKQAHHCNVQRIKPSFYSRSGSDWRKGKAFTRGDLIVHGLAKLRSQQRP